MENIKYRVNIISEVKDYTGKPHSLNYYFAIFDYLNQAIFYINNISAQAEMLGADIISKHNFYRLEPDSNVNLLYSVYINNKDLANAYMAYGYLKENIQLHLYKADSNIIYDDSKFQIK